MLKIKDNTSKQKLTIQDCSFWNPSILKGVLLYMKSIRNGVIYINDETVKLYNKEMKSMKSNASFVKYVRRLNKHSYLDGLVEKVEEWK